MKRHLVQGVGINDCKRSATVCINGKRKITKEYATWHSMLVRCYNEKYQSKFISYKNCKVCEEWLTFSNFKAWMEKQDWEGKELDKDLLGYGKLYSPDTCCFLTKKQNYFLTYRSVAYLFGAKRHSTCDRYEVSVQDSTGTYKSYVGLFKTEADAHEAWRKRKWEIAQILFAGCESRIMEAINEKYGNKEFN